MAVSDGVDHINREIIESAKFRFLEKSISGRNYSPATEENLLNIKGVQDGQNGNGFYSSEEALLNDLLKNENVKHHFLKPGHHELLQNLFIIKIPCPDF